jgi:hypothetical protein
LKKLQQYTLFVLLVFLFGAACFGLGVGLKEEEKKDEVHGVVAEKYQKRVVMNTWSHYETEKQYWVKLKNGQQVQIPAYLYQTVDKGEKVSLMKIKGGNLYISDQNNLEGTGQS